MRNTNPQHITLLAALMTMICAGQAAAQTPPAPQPDPLPFVQAATACVHRDDDAPEEWRQTWQRTQLWSLYYGYSLAETFSRTPETPPANCGANMGRLQTAFFKAENTYGAGWRGIQRDARAVQNAKVLLSLSPHYAYGWCDAMIAKAAPVMKFDPTQLGIDPATPQGQARIAAMDEEFDHLVIIYEQRSFDAEPAGEAGRQATRDEYERAQNDFKAYSLSITRSGDIVQSVVAFANGKELMPFASREAERLFLTTELAACRAAAQ
jgi:hypothetical protein